MKEAVKHIIRAAVSPLDLEIKRLSRTPQQTLLGLKRWPIRSILDIGANEGQYARILSDHFKEAHIVSFEPIPVAFEQLKRAGLRQHRALPIAIGAENGNLVMEEHIAHSSSSSFLPATDLSREYYPGSRDTKQTTVKVMTLDAAVEEYRIPLIAEILVKMDVQGFEDRVIRGGTNVFRQARACITEICLDRLYEGQATFLDLVAKFATIGLQYAGNIEQSCADDGHVIFVDALFVRP